ncbi:MAG: glycosyltransferase family 4 protein [bacterium]
MGLNEGCRFLIFFQMNNEKRYNILIINHRDLTHPDAGGAEVLVHELMAHLGNEGHKIILLCSGYKGAKKEEVLTDRILLIRIGKQTYFNYFVPFYYLKKLRDYNFDIIIECLCKVPSFIPFFAKGKPVLTLIPHLFGTTVFQETNFLVAGYVFGLEKFVPSVYKNSHFLAISNDTKDDIIKRKISSSDNIQVAYCGIDHSLYKVDKKVKKYESPTIIYIGRIRKYKRIDLIIKAVNILIEDIPDIQLDIIGAGKHLRALKDLAKKLQIEHHLNFLGFCEDSVKIKELQKSHILVQCSPKEGWGLTVIEGNACGLPIIASNSPGLREAVQDEITGFLVEHGDVQELADKIKLLLTDHSLWKKMSENAVQWAKTFTWEGFAQRTLSVINSKLSPTLCVGEQK